MFRSHTPIIPSGVDLTHHHRLRAILQQHQDAIVATLSKKALMRCADELGILSPDGIEYDSPSELVILADFCIYNHGPSGKTPVEKYLARLPATDDPDQLAVRSAMSHARYVVYRIDRVEKGVGILAADLLRGETYPLVDEMLTVYARPGHLMAGRLLPILNYYMTSGAAFPITSTAAELAEMMRNIDAIRSGTPAGDVLLARRIIHQAMLEGTTSQAEYL